LIFTVLFVSLLGLVVKERRQSAREQEMASKLQQHGWSVMLAGPFDSLPLLFDDKEQGWWRRVAHVVLGDRVAEVGARGRPFRSCPDVLTFTNLQSLDLDDTHIRDLTPLSELEHLSILRISVPRTLVDDLTPLVDLKCLRYLDVSGTRVNKEQVEALKEALPDCVIDHDPFP
jgi:hypothetical protein